MHEDNALGLHVEHNDNYVIKVSVESSGIRLPLILLQEVKIKVMKGNKS